NPRRQVLRDPRAPIGGTRHRSLRCGLAVGRAVQLGPAGIAEPLAARVLRAAPRALGRHEHRRAAASAEAGLRRVGLAAGGTVHGGTPDRFESERPYGLAPAQANAGAASVPALSARAGP